MALLLQPEANMLTEEIIDALIDGQRSLESIGYLVPDYINQWFGRRLQGNIHNKEYDIFFEWDVSKSPYRESTPLVFKSYRMGEMYFSNRLDDKQRSSYVNQCATAIVKFDIDSVDLLNAIKQGILDCLSAAENKVRSILLELYGHVVVDLYDKALILQRKEEALKAKVRNLAVAN